MAKKQTKEVKAEFVKDTKRFHQYGISENEEGIVGSVYIPIGEEGEKSPKEVDVSITL